MFNWLKKKPRKVEKQSEPGSEHDQLISKLEDDICRKIAQDFRNNIDDWQYVVDKFNSYYTTYQKGNHRISIYEGIYSGDRTMWLDNVNAPDVWVQHINRTLSEQSKKKQVIALTDKLRKLECL